MFPVSETDKPLGPVYTPNKIDCGVWHYEQVVGKFKLRRSRPLPNVYRLSRLAQLISFYVNYAYLVNIYVKLHMRVD